MDNNPKPEATGETPAKAPINDELSKKMDDLLNGGSETTAEAPVAEPAPVVEPTPVPEPAPVTEPTPVAEPAPAVEPTPVVEAPKVEPVVESAPTATAVVEPEPKPAEEPAISMPVAQAAPAPAPAKKKSKKGLVIGLTAGVLVLGGGGAAAAAYMIMNSPENIALSAVSNLLNTKDLTVNGSFELIANREDSLFDSVKLTLNTATDNDTQNETTASISITIGEKTVDVSLGTVVVKDYTVYLRLSGIKDAFNQAIIALGGSIENSSKTIIDNTLGEIDGAWWKISVPELIDLMDDADGKSKAKTAYNCVVDVLDKAKGQNNNYVDYYKKNPFVTLKKYEGSKTYATKGTPYTMTVDTEKLTNYYNEVIDNATTDLGLSDCFKDIQGVDVKTTAEKLDKATFDRIFEDAPEMVATIDGFFSHELTGIYLDKDTEEYSGNLTLKFSKTGGSIAAPSDSKSVVKLVETLMTAYQKLMMSSYSNSSNLYIDPDCPSCDLNSYSF